MESVLLDVAGRRRSPATMPGYHRGRPPRNKGEQYPADPPTVEEIVAVMRARSVTLRRSPTQSADRLLWRAGLRISEALSLQETDLDRAPRRCARPAREGRQAPRGRDGPLGMGRSSTPGWRSAASFRSARVLSVIARTDRGAPVGSVGRAQTAASRGAGRGRATAVCAPPAAPCACGRDERNATLNYRSVLARELTAEDARLYGRTRRHRRSRRSTTDD